MPDGAGDLVAGRYRLSGRRGPGGSWQARDEQLDRPVTLRELPLPARLATARPEGPAQADLLDRVLAEARAAARLDHPGVLTVYDVVADGGGAWLVLRSVPGPSLAEETARGALPWPRAARIGAQVADALGYAHEAGVVHGGLTPDDILLAGVAADRALVAGFGVARATDLVLELTGSAPGLRRGALRYLAPEQLDDGAVGPPADLWALGAILYAAVQGRPPFGGSTQAATVAAILARAPAPPAQAGPLRGLLEALLFRDPGQRPDAKTAAAMLNAALDGPAAPVPPVPAASAPSLVPPGPAPVELAPVHPAPVLPAAHQPASAAPELAPASARPPGLAGLAGLAASLRSSPRLLVGAVTGIAMVAILVLVVSLFSGGHARTPAAQAGTLAGTLTDPAGYQAQAVAISADGKTVAGAFASSDHDAGRVDIWTTASGQPASVLADPAAGGRVDVAFSPADANAVAVAGSAGADLWNLASRQSRRYTDPGHQAAVGVTYASDGRSVAVSASGGVIYRLDPASGQRLPGSYTLPAAGAAAAVALSPDGTRLAAVDASGTVHRWRLSGGGPAVFTGATAGAAQSVAFSPDSKALAIASANGQVRLLDLASATFTAPLRVPGQAPRAVAFTPNGASLAVGGADGSVTLWNLADRQPATLRPAVTPAPAAVTSLAFSPDGKVLAVSGASAAIELYSIRYPGS